VKMPQTPGLVLEEGVEVGCGLPPSNRPTVGETASVPHPKLNNLVHVGHWRDHRGGVALAGPVGNRRWRRLWQRCDPGGPGGAWHPCVDRRSGHCLLNPESMVKRAGEVVQWLTRRFPNGLWLRCSARLNKLRQLGPQRAPAEGQLRAGSGGGNPDAQGGQGNPAVIS